MGNLIAQRESYTRAGKTDDIDRTFTHDDLSRLTNTDQYVNDELNKQNVERFLTYNRNGNLLTMIRYENGEQSSNRRYTYTGNRLDRMEKDKVIAWDEIEVHPGGPAIVVPEKVTEDNGTAALDAEISIDTSAIIRPVDPGIILHSRYAHDRNGNLTYDMELQTDFAYNSLNLLEKAMRNDTIVAKYSYLADGTKLSAVNADDCGFAYRGSFTYRADAGGDRVFESTPFGGGRIVATAGNDTEIRYFLTDHLGSVRVVATDKDNVLERNDYQPFGKRWVTPSMPVSDNRDRFNGKEDQSFAGLPFSDYGARMYDRERGRWLSQDPLQQYHSPYVFCGNNPICQIDPFGMNAYNISSTHLNKDNEVVAVYDDGDLGIYYHDKDTTGTIIELLLYYSSDNTSGGGKYVGETYFWDEFVNPETGEVSGKIELGQSFDFTELIDIAQDMNLPQIAKASMSGGIFDIKSTYGNIGRLLNGKYVSARSAGNFLAGYNAAKGTVLGIHPISFKTFQQLAGALHIQSNVKHQPLTYAMMVDIVLWGTYAGVDKTLFKEPYWGEIYYQLRWVGIMQRKIKWHRVLLICGGLLLGLGLVYLVALLVTLRQIEIAWRPITYSKTVSFPEKGVNIHIDTRVGGLLGNHSYITFSGTMKDQVLRDSIVLPDPYAFYKKQGIDTLFVCLSRNETYEVLHRIGPIVVEIRGIGHSYKSGDPVPPPNFKIINTTTGIE